MAFRERGGLWSLWAEVLGGLTGAEAAGEGPLAGGVAEDESSG